MTVRQIILKIWVVFVYTFLFLPILTVIFMSFFTSKYSTFPLGQLTLKWYKLAAADQNILTAVKYSLFISLELQNRCETEKRYPDNDFGDYHR